MSYSRHATSYARRATSHSRRATSYSRRATSYSRHVSRYIHGVPRHTHGVCHAILTACQVEPAVSSVFSSSTHLSAPILARWYRILVPAMPPPMITVSASSGHDVTLQQRHSCIILGYINFHLRRMRTSTKLYPSERRLYCVNALVHDCSLQRRNTEWMRSDVIVHAATSLDRSAKTNFHLITQSPKQQRRRHLPH